MMRKEQATMTNRHEEGAANPQDDVPAYAPDDGAMSLPELEWLRSRAAGELPKGRVISRASLLQPSEGS